MTKQTVFLGMVFGCGSLAYTSVGKTRIRPTTLSGKQLGHLPHQGMSVERSFYFWHKTGDCTGYNSRLQLPNSAKQLMGSGNNPAKIQPPTLERSSIRRWLITYYCCTCLLEHPCASRFVLPILRLLVIKIKKTSGKRLNLLTSKRWHSWLMQGG